MCVTMLTAWLGLYDVHQKNVQKFDSDVGHFASQSVFLGVFFYIFPLLLKQGSLP